MMLQNLNLAVSAMMSHALCALLPHCAVRAVEFEVQRLSNLGLSGAVFYRLLTSLVRAHRLMLRQRRNK